MNRTLRWLGAFACALALIVTPAHAQFVPKRTTANVRSDHIRINAHIVELVRLGRHAEAIDYLAANATAFQNLGGALNNSDRMQWPEEYGPPPPFDPNDPLSRIKRAPSQWAKNLNGLMTQAERAAAIAAGYWTEHESNIIANWWFYMGVKGFFNTATQQYWFTMPTPSGEKMFLDMGCADMASEVLSGLPVPGPALP